MNELTTVDNLEVLTKAEAMIQFENALAHPRDINKCIAEAISIVSMNQEIAEGCIYSVPRAGKMMTGASIRLAEIMIYCFRNVYTCTRLVKNDGRFLSVEGIVIDRERNLVYSETVERSIMTSAKNGQQPKTFSYDMQQTTAAAASSLALRKASFRLLKPFISPVYEAAKKAAIGEAKSSVTKTQQVVSRLQKMGVQIEKILSFLDVEKIEDISAENLADLIGIGTAIKEGSITIENAFDKSFNAETGELLPNKADEINAKLELTEPTVEMEDLSAYI